MRKIMMLLTMTLVAICLYAQQPGERQQERATQSGAAESGDARQPVGDSVPSDTVANGPRNNHANAPGGNMGTVSEPPDAASNAPVVVEKTTSQGGSPAVLSGKDGSDPDGTNNVQRASMNMAGAPAANLRFPENKPATVSTEMDDRQQYSRDKAASAKNDGGQTDEINENNRKENNARSDQNLSSKEREKAPDGGNKRDQKKTRKKRG